MTTRVTMALCILSVSGLVFSAESKTDQDKLEGTWVLVYVDQRFPDLAEDLCVATTRWTIARDVVDVTLEGVQVTRDLKGQKHRFRLTQDVQPKAIDIIPQDGKWKGVAFDGVYSLEGDRLKIRIELDPDSDRPKKVEWGERYADSSELHLKRVRDEPQTDEVKQRPHSVADREVLPAASSEPEPGIRRRRANKRKKSNGDEVAWARAIAEEFWGDLLDSNDTEAAGFLSPEFAGACPDYSKLGGARRPAPSYLFDQLYSQQGTPDLSLKWTSAKISSEEVAPDNSEIIFKGALVGKSLKEEKEKQADFTMRIAKEGNGRWSIRSLRIKARHDSEPEKKEAKPTTSGPEVGDIVSAAEIGKPPRKCRVVQFKCNSDGSADYTLKDVETDEVFELHSPASVR